MKKRYGILIAFTLTVFVPSLTQAGRSNFKANCPVSVNDAYGGYMYGAPGFTSDMASCQDWTFQVGDAYCDYLREGAISGTNPVNLDYCLIHEDGEWECAEPWQFWCADVPAS